MCEWVSECASEWVSVRVCVCVCVCSVCACVFLLVCIEDNRACL